ncbi:MAG: hypothetical protein MRY83_22570 [Flavobacteriales bacterium]|nr:hypothetical protein [Flavobacteriales bacterium]
MSTYLTSFYISICILFCITIQACQNERKVEIGKMILSSNEIYFGQSSNGKVILDTLAKGSRKWKKLLRFGEKNNFGWTETADPGSSDYWIGQGSFRISGWNKNDNIVVSFMNKDKGLVFYSKKGSLPNELFQIQSSR